MTVTYKPYELNAMTGAYQQQVYPSTYPLAVVSGVAITKGTSLMSIVLANITEFTDEPAQKGTFEYAGVFQNVPLFFLRPDKAATMTFRVQCNAYSSLPVFLKYCNSWGQLSVSETEFLQQKTANAAYEGLTIARNFYVTLEQSIKELPAAYGKTQFDINLKFTRVQI